MQTKTRCAACNYEAMERHHIKTRGSGGTDDEFNLLDLCRSCHVKVHNLGLSKFILLFPHLENVLEEKGWEIKTIFGRRSLVRK